MAGYSGKSLAEKLGLKEGMRVYLKGEPKDYKSALGALGASATFYNSGTDFSLIHYFTQERSGLENNLPTLKERLTKDGSLWVSWPKGGSKKAGDLNENIVREIGLAHGLVDVKVIAVDETWSGLKFVYRLKDR